jgi:hypothetical protein
MTPSNVDQVMILAFEGVSDPHQYDIGVVEMPINTGWSKKWSRAKPLCEPMVQGEGVFSLLLEIIRSKYIRVGKMPGPPGPPAHDQGLPWTTFLRQSRTPPTTKRGQA